MNKRITSRNSQTHTLLTKYLMPSSSRNVVGLNKYCTRRKKRAVVTIWIREYRLSYIFLYDVNYLVAAIIRSIVGMLMIKLFKLVKYLCLLQKERALCPWRITKYFIFLYPLITTSNNNKNNSSAFVIHVVWIIHRMFMKIFVTQL